MREGVAWAVMHGAGERYVQPFVVLEGATLFQLASISALPSFLGALVQALSADVTDRIGRRKRLFMGGAFLQALCWIPVCVAVFLPVREAFWLMACAYALFVGLQNFNTPPWSSLMGDLVPSERRGRYFGFRNVMVGTGICASFLGAGWWLERCRSGGLSGFGLEGLPFGFLTIFALAGVSRIVSVWYLWRMAEPAYIRSDSDRFTFIAFVRRLFRGNFGRFTLYTTLLHFGVGIAGPYFGWYTLTHLGYNPAEFAWVWTAHLVTFFAAQPLWGKLSDRIGNKPLIAIGGVGIAAIPVLWLVSTDFRYLAAVQVYDGVVWAAFAIAAGNYLYDCVPPPKRARCTAYHAILVATGGMLGTFVGAALGGVWKEPFSVLGFSFTHPFEGMLAASALARLLPAFVLLGAFREVRVAPAHWMDAYAKAGRTLPLLKRWWR